MDHYHYYYLVYHITLLCFKFFLKKKREVKMDSIRVYETQRTKTKKRRKINKKCLGQLAQFPQTLALCLQ